MLKSAEKIVLLAKKKSQDKEQLVLDAIQTMKAQRQKITFYSVQKTTGVSKSYLYNNSTLRKAITELRDGVQPSPSDADTTETLLAAMKLELRDLRKRLRAYEKDGLYKEKYEAMRAERDHYKTNYERLLGERY